jgi:hypothetical protein
MNVLAFSFMQRLLAMKLKFFLIILSAGGRKLNEAGWNVAVRQAHSFKYLPTATAAASGCRVDIAS